MEYIPRLMDNGIISIKDGETLLTTISNMDKLKLSIT